MSTNSIPHELAFIALLHSGGRIRIMQYTTRQTAGSLSKDAAAAAGFVLSDDKKFWNRPASPALIDAEIAHERRADIDAELGPLVSWQKLKRQPDKIERGNLLLPGANPAQAQALNLLK